MNTKTLLTVITVVVITGIIGYVAQGSRSSTNTSTNPDSQTPQTAQSPIDKLTYYYGDTCPYCKEVLEWMNDNQIETKLEIDKKEVYNNRTNSLELSLVAKSCGLPSRNIGVPFLYTQEGDCLVGAPDIQEYLAKLISQTETKLSESTTSADTYR